MMESLETFLPCKGSPDPKRLRTPDLSEFREKHPLFKDAHIHTHKNCSCTHEDSFIVYIWDCLKSHTIMMCYLVVLWSSGVKRPSQEELSYYTTQRPHVYGLTERQAKDDLWSPADTENTWILLSQTQWYAFWYACFDFCIFLSGLIIMLSKLESPECIFGHFQGWFIANNL